MEFIHRENEIVIENENGEMIAIALFPTVSNGVVEIVRTFVSDVLRGQGVAGKLMEELIANLEKTNRKAIPTCSYAVGWFEKHPECANFLAKGE